MNNDQPILHNEQILEASGIEGRALTDVAKGWLQVSEAMKETAQSIANQQSFGLDIINQFAKEAEAINYAEMLIQAIDNQKDILDLYYLTLPHTAEIAKRKNISLVLLQPTPKDLKHKEQDGATPRYELYLHPANMQFSRYFTLFVGSFPSHVAFSDFKYYFLSILKTLKTQMAKIYNTKIETPHKLLNAGEVADFSEIYYLMYTALFKDTNPKSISQVMASL